MSFRYEIVHRIVKGSMLKYVVNHFFTLGREGEVKSAYGFVMDPQNITKEVCIQVNSFKGYLTGMGFCYFR